MTSRSSLGLAALLCAAAVVTPAVAQLKTAFLAPQQAARAIMDGRPWTATTAEGRQMQATFNADGTASMRGPMPFPLSASWQIMGQDICLATAMGTKCLRFRPAANGFDGFIGDKLDLRLTR